MKILFLLMAITAIALVIGLFKSAHATPHAAFQRPRRYKGLKRTWRKFMVGPSWLEMFIGLLTATMPKPQVTFANIGEGSFEHGRKSYIADAAASYRYLLYKAGTDADHVAVCTNADVPLGPSDDQADAGMPIAINLLGAVKGSQRVVTDGSIANGDLVISADAGQARKLLATTGTYYIIGKAVIGTDASANAGDVITIIPCFPTQRVVA